VKRRAAFRQFFYVFVNLPFSDDNRVFIGENISEMKAADREPEQKDGETVKQSIRLLIADDRLSSRNGLKALLATQAEIEIVGEAADGQEAVQLVEQYRPDAVLMDVQMPVIDGLEATRMIKGRWPEVKVIVLSMYSSSQAEALAAGADAFLVKGCATEDLFQAIL